MITHKITFKHYRTDEEITVFGYPMDNYNTNPSSDMFIFYDMNNERIEAVIKKSIVSMVPYKDES